MRKYVEVFTRDHLPKLRDQLLFSGLTDHEIFMFIQYAKPYYLSLNRGGTARVENKFSHMTGLVFSGTAYLYSVDYSGNKSLLKTIRSGESSGTLYAMFDYYNTLVEIMTRVTYELSGFNASKIIGTGTTLDTARLRYLLGEYFEVDPRNIHAYVIGEHGDSEFVPWSQALLAAKPLKDVMRDNPKSYYMEELEQISDDVRCAAHKIIEAKGATYYGIGMSIVRIVRAILQDENSVLTVSVRLRGEYGGKKDVFIGNPCIVSANGAKRILELKLTEQELQKLDNSCTILNDNFKKLKL
jgi:L-lactate dehydrogenase